MTLYGAMERVGLRSQTHLHINLRLLGVYSDVDLIRLVPGLNEIKKY